MYRSHLSRAVSQEEQPGGTSCVVAGELEASPEAARPYPKGVRDFDIPAVGGAVRQGGVGRDSKEPIPGASGMDLSRRWLHHGGQTHDEHKACAS
jgi:hypothetical protein